MSEIGMEINDKMFTENTGLRITEEFAPVLAIVDNELALEALWKNILILEDPFRTGYECKTCDGKGHSEEICSSCSGSKVKAKNPEYDQTKDWDENSLEGLPEHFKELMRKKQLAENKQREEYMDSGGLIPCTSCLVVSHIDGSKYPSGFKICPTCKGVGASIVVPEESMRRPTSGKIVAMGSEVKGLNIGDRVVYSNMIGQQISFKQKSVFRLMRYDECNIRLHGVKSEEFQKKLK